MEQLSLVFSIIVMFIIRLGIPVLVLMSIGVLIDRIQSRREEHLPHTDHKPVYRL